MAVYTKIEKRDLDHLFNSVGRINEIKGITEGVENTNYLITLENNSKLIFTIFERRTKASDLPFFNKAMSEFKNNGINCPVAVNLDGKSVFKIKDKPCAIYSFIQGSQIKKINYDSLFSLASFISKIHKIGLKSNLKRENNMLKPTWIYILNKFKDYDGIHLNNLSDIKKEIIELEDLFPANIRNALIHADLFKDNIFFQNDKVSGLIDFFFTCTDSITYDLATLVNAWFFSDEKFDEKNFEIFFRNYLNLIDWDEKEKSYFNFYLKASAIRFYLTRLHDKYFNSDGIVKHKDPLEFYDIMRFHKKNNLQDFF